MNSNDPIKVVVCNKCGAHILKPKNESGESELIIICSRCSNRIIIPENKYELDDKDLPLLD